MRFNVLAKKAEAFFEEAGGHHGRHGALPTRNWALLAVEQKASADGIRRELGKTLPRWCGKFRIISLLYKRDLERFAKLGRTYRTLLSGLSRFAVTKSATSLPTCFERHARKLGNRSNLLAKRPVATASCRQRPFSKSRS